MPSKIESKGFVEIPVDEERLPVTGADLDASRELKGGLGQLEVVELVNDRITEFQWWRRVPKV